MTFYWDSGIARYRRDDGRLVGSVQVRRWTRQMISGGADPTAALAQMVSAGTLRPSDWEMMMRQEIKDNYITQYIAGRGGREAMRPSDWGRIGGMLKNQYHPYLDRFVEDVRVGKLSEAQIAARAQMYVESSQQAYWRADRVVREEAGYPYMTWDPNPALENCDDCLSFEAMGKVRVEDDPFGGCFPGSGCTQCLTKCGCEINYYKEAA